jgi:hypothetical protein
VNVWTREDERVLRTFTDGDRLIRIPAKWKKRYVILRWLVEEFDFDKDYPEAEFNEILRRHHLDVATLRREMFESGLVFRNRGVYRRNPNPPDPQF